MAFDKAKVVRAAEKYLAQGKIPAAILEYRQIVENDADDFTALNMLGDLYARENEKQPAIQCFLRIAEHYREEGFQSKAIAMYKKIDRLNPRSPEIANKLAALYESQGLIVDARAQYMVIAEACLRDGQTRKALDIFRKVADLDPQNTEARIKLAQGYLRESLPDEAAAAYIEAGAQFLARGDYERAAEVYTSALEIHPLDYTALNGLLDTHIALGTPDEAAELLEQAVAAQPENIELLSMLANAYLEAEDGTAAERVVTALVVREASSYERFIDVARLYFKEGDVDAAVKVLSAITEQLLSSREEEKLMELLNEALKRNPDHIEALRLLVRVYAWERDDEKQRQTLERLVEAAEAASLPDVESSALMQLAQFSPDQRYLERLQALGHLPEPPAETSTTPAPTPPVEEVPSFESFALVNDDATGSAMGMPPTEEAAEFEFNSVAEPTVPVAPDPSASFADLNEDWTDTTPSGDFQEFDFGGEAAPTPATEAGDAAGAIDERREALLKQELDSVDFYLAQGYMDIAADTLDMLERQFGAHPQINARRAKLNQPAQPSAVAPSTPATIEFESSARYDIAAEAAPIEAESVGANQSFAEVEVQPSASQQSVPSETATPKSSQTAAGHGLDPGLAAIFDEFRTAAEEEETHADDGDYETHYNLGTAYQEMELLDEAVEEFQVAVGMAAPKDGTPRYLQCCNMLGHCFMRKSMPRLAMMWFRKGLDAPGHTEDEYQALRYDLGAAYEQMGDLDKAIEIFSEVYGINISYRGVAERLRELQAQKAVTGDR
jgi:tetratricopeptide (TPR) repeat protein